MKPAWNSLLIALTLLLPTSASIVLAEPRSPRPTVENRAPNTPASETRPTLTPEETARQQKLIAADRLYLAGDIAAAEKLYRQVKEPFPQTTETKPKPAPITDASQLPPAARVYWREAEAGISQNAESRILVPLQLLVEQYPQFIPGHLRLAQVLRERDRTSESRQVLERASQLYPNQTDLLKAKIAALVEDEKWLDASVSARQFALLNANHPDAAEFSRLADENMKRYQRHLRRKIRGSAIAGSLIGGLSWFLTGRPYGTFSSVETAVLLLQGESKIGDRITSAAKRQLRIVEDKEVNDYLNEIGQKLAKVTGRNDFKYEFYVILDDDLNAFALPGGKIFINAGAITKSKSEAELAGLLAHELSHAVLSHGFQLLAQGNLLGNATEFLPRGRWIVGNLLFLNYSRDMERQSDIFGTKILAASGYAADGLRNLMVTLEKEDKDYPIGFLSSHPDSDDRVRYLEKLIIENNYNRYAYEGVARHAEIKERLEKLLAEEKQRRRRNRRR